MIADNSLDETDFLGKDVPCPRICALLKHRIPLRPSSRASMQRRNKRKSLEPKKLNVSTSSLDHEEAHHPVSLEPNTPIKRQRLGSTGSDERSSPQNSMSPGSSHHEIHSSRSPSPTAAAGPPPSSSLAPKLRFKQTAAKAALISAEVEHEEQKKTKKSQRAKHDTTPSSAANPFRPWDDDSPDEKDTEAHLRSSIARLLPTTPYPPSALLTPELQASLSAMLLRPGGVLPLGFPSIPLLPTTYTPPPEQDEPLALIKHKREGEDEEEEGEDDHPTPPPPPTAKPQASSVPQPLNMEAKWRREAIASALMANLQPDAPGAKGFSRSHTLDDSNDSPQCHSPTLSASGSKGKQRNYKNMTRERRVEANARERQRVHTITAAFDTLQNAIPSEDSSQKLSKLSIIKIATSYIMVLSRMAGYDYSSDQSAPSVQDCINSCTDLIYSESKARKKTNGRDSD
eukprot:maker-scaffold579_size130606-snap-gene-0.18 protein:Tk02373 transcript:maker-scaffold579_size130606-snap-gene-0.18-mRNA-1 annotation:"GL13900"